MGVTVVPVAGSPNVATWVISSAAATREFTPFHGSSPACAALPCTTSSNVPVPLRAIFTAPPSALGSHTSTAPQATARSSMSSRLAPLPTSSSAVMRISTPARASGGNEATACSACTIPPFMSKTPGPVARPSTTANGRSATVPAGNTVS